MKILCTICARGGSKGVKNKNIKKFLGKPLIYHTISQARKIKKFTKIVCSSDSKKILEIAKKNKVDYVVLRPKFLSNDNVSKIKAIKHCLIKSESFFKTKFDFIVDLDVTAPLRVNRDIIQIINKIKNSEDADNIICLSESKKNPYFNMVEIKKNKIKLVKKSLKKYNARQNAPKVFDINAGVYAWRRIGLLRNSNLINKKTQYLIVPSSRSIDIDSEIDFKITRLLLSN